MSTRVTHDSDWVIAALRRHESRLVRYVQRLVGDLEVARDVVQDCFLRLCRQRREDVDDHLTEWLFTVCRNRAIDHLRKSARMQSTDDIDTLVATRVADEAPPSARAEHAEEADRLLSAVGALPPRQQEVVRLKFQEGMSYRQISDVTGTSVGNVGYVLHTALRTLRARLGQRILPASSQGATS